MAKEVIMKCPDCGTIVRGKMGYIFHRRFTCSNCYRTINPRTDNNETVVCSGCGNAVIYDTKIGREQKCPLCNTSLAEHSYTDVKVTCPSCNMKQIVKSNEIKHICAICNYEFNVKEQEKSEKALESVSATVITVPKDNQNIIWKHPMTVFPFASHVVVPEGYTGLILRDGICSQPSYPGKYVLSDTIRSMKDQLEYALLEESAQVSVQIIFVKNQLDKEFPWTGQKQTVTNQLGNIVGTLGFGGSITLAITDSKRFAEFVGYDAATLDQLINFSVDNRSKLCKYASDKAYDITYQVLMSAVMNSGFAYGALDANKLYFKNQIKDILDRELASIGVTSVIFNLDFVNYEEDESLKTVKIDAKLKSENTDNVRRYVQHTFRWESPAIPIHMKGDITLSADVIFGGDIQFKIMNDVFFENPDIQYWMKNGVTETEVEKYCIELTKACTANVIRDILQPMIDDTNADIRDLTSYYRYIRENIREELSDYFAKDGLSVSLFNMEERSRKQSSALNAKGDVEVHKTEAQIQQDLYIFNQKQRVEKAKIDSQTELDLDTNAVETERAYTKNHYDRTQNKIDRMYIDETLLTTTDKIDRDRLKRYEAEEREDRESVINYTHEQNINKYKRSWEMSDLEYQTIEKRNAYGKGINAMEHENELINFKHKADLTQAAHSADMQKRYYQRENIAADHDTEMMIINDEKEKRLELHYLNKQEIESRAKEMYAQWEAQTNMQYSNLQHQIRMRDTKWEDDKHLIREQNALQFEQIRAEDALRYERTREQYALQHEIDQSAAQNERVINDILRKIAESDLDLKEKKDAYSRLLRNQESEDKLHYMGMEADLRRNANYQDSHMRNTLKKEENDMAFEESRRKNALKSEENDIFFQNEHMKNLLTQEEKDFLDQLNHREYVRRENSKNEQFQRDMQVKEMDIAHEMDLLKMEYDRYQMEASLNQEIKNKNIEIEKLKLMIQNMENMGEQDVKKLGMGLEAETTTIKADYDYRTARDQADYDYRTARDQAEYGYRKASDEAKYGAMSDLYRSRYQQNEQMRREERDDRIRREREERDDREQQRIREEKREREDRERMDRYERESREDRLRSEQNKIDLERSYMERADQLLSQMLSIQAALKNHSLDNEKSMIESNTQIHVSKFESDAIIGMHRNDERMKNMETLIKQMSESIQQLNSSVKELKKKQNEKSTYQLNYPGQGGFVGGNNIPPYTNNGANSGNSNHNKTEEKKKCECGHMNPKNNEFCEECGHVL